MINFLFIVIIITILIFLFLQIRIFLLQEFKNNLIDKTFELEKFFYNELKKEVDKKNYDVLVDIYYNTSLFNIYRNYLNEHNKIIFNFKEEKKILLKGLFAIYYIYQNKDYNIDYFIKDIEILKTKDLKSQYLRLSILFNLCKLNYNKKAIFNLKESL